ncbi:HIT family protein [Candidatus Galacturonibacter soehngenii]|uniref:HIT family protein n=1 Tax=Candidatus Galacturonatibacter soehngenii TaxID=2307010 RepID=A0A7V7QHU1_9FIRM|nr:HIT family protein [Candidatus Galacturonibacter soehngenii]KAB1434498.1 HIT family protein [Candidatus Galacturonibacter soehngenii]MBA4688921.1 HIT family protein [Candidatus Galacturonibacter soehngenii]
MCIVCDRIKLIKDNQNPYFVKELETGYVVIGDYQMFRGYTLFLCKQHEIELYDLEKDFMMKYLEEMALVAKAVAKAFHAEKMNYELLGNKDTHLHWHLFPRVKGDIGEYGRNGVGPVWWVPSKMMYDDQNKPTQEELRQLKEILLKELN